MTKYKHLLNSDLHHHHPKPFSDLINASNAKLSNALELGQELRQRISLLHSSKERKSHGYI